MSETCVKENLKKTGAPPIVKLDKALKLAELWVNNMSKTADDDTTNVDAGVRHPRLGLGASTKVLRHSKFEPSNDPVERKLFAKLNAEKRKAANTAKETAADAADVLDDYEDDGDAESRTSAFVKRKAAVPLTSSILGNKKQK